MPAGSHEVTFIYRPGLARAGLTISAASLVALVACAIVSGRC